LQYDCNSFEINAGLFDSAAWVCYIVCSYEPHRQEVFSMGLFDSAEELARKATSIIGTPDSLPFGDRVVGVVMNRDGSVLDKIYNIR